MIRAQPFTSQATTAFLLCLLLSALQACSSTRDSGNDGGQGTGGVTILGTGGNGTGGTGGAPVDAARDAWLDAAPAGTPFDCGGGALSCAVGQTYCRQISGQLLPDGGQFPTRYDCATFKTDCPAGDCSCIVTNPGNVYCFACEQMPSGAVLAHCGPV